MNVRRFLTKRQKGPKWSVLPHIMYPNVPFGGFGPVTCGYRGGYEWLGGELGLHLRVGYLHRGRCGRHAGLRVALRVGTYLGGDRVGTYLGGDRVGVFLGGDRGGDFFGGVFLFDRLGNHFSNDGNRSSFVVFDCVVEFVETSVMFCFSIPKKSALTNSVLEELAVSMSYFHFALAKVAYSQVITLAKIANANPNVQNISVYLICVHE